jgi:hypothetical protein
MANTRVLYSVPVTVRRAIEAEAARVDSTPSRVVSEFFAEKLPDFLRDSIASTFQKDADV